MIQFSAHNLFSSGAELQRLMDDCVFAAGIGAVPIPLSEYHKKPSQELSNGIAESLRQSVVQFELLGCSVAAAMAKDLIKKSSAMDLSLYDLKQQIANVVKIFREEASAKVCFYVPPEKLRFWPRYSNPNIFGESVAEAFPSAGFDIREAGACLGSARATAAVFHLMRALEVAIVALCSELGLPFNAGSWNTALNQLEKKVTSLHVDPEWKSKPNVKGIQQFYAQAVSHFQILKDAWRNYTAHHKGVYTEENAALIFDNVKSFMVILASRNTQEGQVAP